MKFTEEEIKESVAAYGHALKTGSKKDLEVRPRNDAESEWIPAMADSIYIDTIYRIKPKLTAEDYERLQKEWIEKHDVKIGDCVKILRAPNFKEMGWYSFEAAGVENVIGEVFEITVIDGGNFGIELNTSEPFVYLPFCVLEKVEPPKPEYRPFKNAAEFIASGIQWVRPIGCKSAPFIAVSKIYDDGTTSDGTFREFQTLSEEFETPKGTPCGVEIGKEDA